MNQAIVRWAFAGFVAAFLAGCASDAPHVHGPSFEGGPAAAPSTPPTSDASPPPGPAPPGPAQPDAATPPAGGPDGFVNGVMMQGFYWNVPASTPGGSWWNTLASKAAELAAAGVNAIWIPPPYKGASGANDAGYGVYDRYDLGEFDQKGTIATRYGTLAELQAAIAALHASGLHVYGDVVMNHMMGADTTETFSVGGATYTAPTGFAFAGRGGAYSTFAWGHDHFNGCRPASGWIQWHPWDFAPYANGDAWDNLLGCEIRYADPADRAELVGWGQWITQKLALDGYRLDATKHMLTSFVNQWLDAVKGPRFAVSEAWFGDLGNLLAYASSTGGRTTLFDVPLHYAFYAMSQGAGGWDMRGLAGAGLVSQNGPLAVTFVDNHDTDNTGGLHSPVSSFKLLAYAYILTRADGYPCIFYKDYYEYGYGPQIRALIQIRKAHAYGGGIELPESDANVYAYARAGDASHAGLLLLLNDGPATTKAVATPFRAAMLIDATGGEPGTIATDANGRAAFPVAAGGYGVWIPAQ